MMTSLLDRINEARDSAADPKDLQTTFEDVFDGLAYEALQILFDRQRKYGPENIRRQGLWGIFTRIKDDKIARLQTAFNGVIRKGQIVLDTIEDNPNVDETFEDALFDVANYALIMIAVKRGVWGKPLRENTDELATLAAAHPDGVPQLTLTPEEEEAERARQFLAGLDDDETSLVGRLATEEDLDELDAGDPMPDREAAAERLEQARLARDLGGKD